MYGTSLSLLSFCWLLFREEIGKSFVTKSWERDDDSGRR